MISLALGLFVLGMACGCLIENVRVRALEAIELEKIPIAEVVSDPMLELLEAQTGELRLQNKKLDTLIMHQAYMAEDPEITQDIPIVEQPTVPPH